MKKLFGKRAVALLTTMAILVSLVAMLSGLSLTGNAVYEPKRAISIESVNGDINAKMLMTKAGTKLGVGKTVTIKGYYKVENYSVVDENQSPSVNLGAGLVLAHGDTDGWVAFEKTGYETSDSNWWGIEFWYTNGKISLADVVITEGSTVIYDMATDTDLIAGTYTTGQFPQQHGMWYLSPYNAASIATLVVDPVYTEPYTPKRAMSITASNGDVNSKFVILGSGTQLGAGQEVTVKGYYKVENFSVVTGSSDERVIIASGVANVYEDTDGWVYFEKTNYVTGDSNWLNFEFWYANGTLSLADITFVDGDGNVIYDMATDTLLPEGTHGSQTVGMWYMSHYTDPANVVIKIDPVYTPPYTPKRAMSITASNGDVNSKFVILGSGTQLGADKTVTVKGYYKVEDFSIVSGSSNERVIIASGVANVYEDTDGWVYFEKTDYVTGDSNWLNFEFWYANGTLSLADITFVDGEGNVIYDMATDALLPEGTHGSQTVGMWYMSHYTNPANVVIEIDPVYVPEVYTPKRVISMTTAGTQINGKICLYYTGQLGAGKEVTVKGYYKVDNYSAWAERTEGDQVIWTPAGDVKADCGWTSFEKNITTGDAHSLCFEFWYAQGTISIADLTVQEVGGDYLYDMTSDADLVAGTYTSANWDAEQSLFYFGFFGNIDAATYTIGEKVDGGIVVVPPPYDPELVELPSIPNLITADPNGYTPNRAFAVINSIHASPKVNYATFATTDDYAVAGNKYYVFLKYAIGELTPIDSDAAYGAYIKLNGTDVLNSNTESPNWMDLTDAEGNLFTFDAVEDGDIISMVFGLNNAKGMFAVADLIIANQNGEIVYSLANDKTMHIETDMRYVSNGYWNADPYVCDKAGPNLFPIQTKIENPYTPNSYVSLTANDKKKGTTAESFLYFRTNELFEAGKTYTITGMFKAQIDKGYNGNANPLLKFSDSGGQAQIVDITNHGTNGNWYPLVAADGSPVTFKGTTVEDWLKVNLYCAYGTVALADLVITDSEGNVVYEMVNDQSLMAVKGEFTGNVAGLGDLMRHALYNNGVGEVYFAEQKTENTELSQQIPTFNESVTIPGGDDECDHNFVDGECEFCGEPDPNYQPPVDDPCANGHDFVDGYCTRCQEADPDYDPNGPSQTGDESMLFVAALGMFAVAALAVVTLNKKKFIG